MNKRVLFVDDEANILSGFLRQFHRVFDAETAQGGKEGLIALKEKGPFAAVISDMRMPEMDGIEFLKQVEQFNPDIVRIMLTGNADQKTAMDAVNDGHIFRFLTKPCPPEIMTRTIEDAFRQFQIISAERELLEKTLKGVIRVLTEILSLVNPVAFSQTSRIRRYTSRIVQTLELPNLWQFELAAMLSQIGCVTMPATLLDMILSGNEIPEEDQKLFASHPVIGSDLLRNIPRMEIVSEMIRDQQLPFSAFVPPLETMKKYLAATGAQILRAVIDFDRLVFRGKTPKSVLAFMRQQKDVYNPHVLDALEKIDFEGEERVYVLKTVTVRELVAGMELTEDVRSKTGVLLVPKGQEVTYPILSMLHNFSLGVGIEEPLLVKYFS